MGGYLSSEPETLEGRAVPEAQQEVATLENFADQPLATPETSAEDQPLDVLNQILLVERRCVPSTSVAANTRSLQKHALRLAETGGTVEESISVEVMLDEPDVRYCICFEETSPIFMGCLWMRHEDAFVEDIMASLATYDERQKWNPDDSAVLRGPVAEDPTQEEVHWFLINVPRPFWDREMLKKQWKLPLEMSTGTGIALVSRSFEDDSLRSVGSGHVRGFVHKGGFLIRPTHGDGKPGVEFTNLSQVDMGGLIPSWAAAWLSSLVVAKGVEWGQKLVQHALKLRAERLRKLRLSDLPAEEMRGWAENWDSTEHTNYEVHDDFVSKDDESRGWLLF